MPNPKYIVTDGVVTEHMKGGMFRVQLNDNQDHQVVCTQGGRFRRAKITLALGDTVQIHISPYDLTRGRIVWRLS